MASGVKVQGQCVDVFQEMKLNRTYRYVIYKVGKDLKEIEVCLVGKPEESYCDFEGHMKAAEGDRECRYGVFDAEYTTKEGGSKRNKLVFVMWSPNDATIKQKMVYTSSKDALKKCLVGIGKEMQATDHEELSWESCLDICTKNERE